METSRELLSISDEAPEPTPVPVAVTVTVPALVSRVEANEIVVAAVAVAEPTVSAVPVQVWAPAVAVNVAAAPERRVALLTVRFWPALSVSGPVGPAVMLPPWTVTFWVAVAETPAPPVIVSASMVIEPLWAARLIEPATADTVAPLTESVPVVAVSEIVAPVPLTVNDAAPVPGATVRPVLAVTEIPVAADTTAPVRLVAALDVRVTAPAAELTDALAMVSAAGEVGVPAVMMTEALVPVALTDAASGGGAGLPGAAGGFSWLMVTPPGADRLTPPPAALTVEPLIVSCPAAAEAHRACARVQRGAVLHGDAAGRRGGQRPRGGDRARRVDRQVAAAHGEHGAVRRGQRSSR